MADFKASHDIPTLMDYFDLNRNWKTVELGNLIVMIFFLLRPPLVLSATYLETE
jgi:hypothetical protein